MAVFVGERFSPLAYGPLILAFVACGAVGAAAATGHAVSVPAFLGSVVVVVAAFLRLRFLDEIKDLEVDRLGRPWRPLPRGLVTAGELRWGARMALGTMVVTAVLLGPGAMAAMVLVAAFGVGAGEDFFQGERIRRRPLAYALAHSPAAPLLLVFTWAAQPGAGFQPALWWLVVLAWGVSLGLEVGRKTVAPAEERRHVETYSAVLGQPRAALLAAGSLALGGVAVAAYARAVALPPAAEWAGLAACAAILGSWLAIRRAPGRVLEAWSGTSGLLLLLLVPVMAWVGGLVR